MWEKLKNMLSDEEKDLAAFFIDLEARVVKLEQLMTDNHWIFPVKDNAPVVKQPKTVPMETEPVTISAEGTTNAEAIG